MKKLNLLLTILIASIALNCASDDDSSDTNQDEIVGTWNLISIENQGNNVNVIDCQTEQNIIYTINNTGSEKGPEEISETPCQFNTTQFSWERNGSQVTLIVNEEGTFIYEILMLTDTRLEIVVVEMNGTVVPQEEQEVFKYEK